MALIAIAFLSHRSTSEVDAAFGEADARAPETICRLS
jgi:hypothetical protein